MSKNYALRRTVGPDVFEAWRELVYMDGTEGVVALAAFLGIKTGTLYNKADASDDSHHQPTLREVIQATHYRGDFRVLDALNEMFGRASYDAARHANTTDEALLELLTALGAETGQFHQALSAGLKERRFTAATLRTIRGEAFDIVSALMTLCNRLEGYVDEDDSDPHGA